MDKFNGIGPNFNGVNNKKLYGEKSKNLEPKEAAKEALNADAASQIKHKKPDDVLNSMHQYGMLNSVVPKKIGALKNDSHMKQRIGEFIKSFEDEVEKGLTVFNKEFPGQPENVARHIVSEAVLKASDL